MIEYIKLRTSRLTAMIHQTRNTVTNSKMFYQKWKIIQIDWCMFRLFKEGNACIHQTKNRHHVKSRIYYFSISYV